MLFYRASFLHAVENYVVDRVKDDLGVMSVEFSGCEDRVDPPDHTLCLPATFLSGPFPELIFQPCLDRS